LLTARHHSAVATASSAFTQTQESDEGSFRRTGISCPSRCE
jgi:hypothetical protein